MTPRKKQRKKQKRAKTPKQDQDPLAVFYWRILSRARGALANHEAQDKAVRNALAGESPTSAENES